MFGVQVDFVMSSSVGKMPVNPQSVKPKESICALIVRGVTDSKRRRKRSNVCALCVVRCALCVVRNSLACKVKSFL